MAKNAFTYPGDEEFRRQLEKLKLPVTVEQVRERITAATQGDAVVTPAEIMGELAGKLMEDENVEDAMTAQAFAMSFLSLWNEAVAARPEGEANDVWKAKVQEKIEVEAKEARKPYIAPARPGRNDPCHCGSGKKFKKCHGG